MIQNLKLTNFKQHQTLEVDFTSGLNVINGDNGAGKSKELPPLVFLKECFCISETGELFWNERPRSHFDTDQGRRVFNSHYKGKAVGSVNARGYLRLKVRFNGKLLYLLAHRVIWKISLGIEPPEVIDHINGVNTDNRLENLRVATHSENQVNARNKKVKSSCGLRGVTKRGVKFESAIKKDGKTIYLGTFLSKEEAHLAYCTAANTLYGAFHFNGETND